MLGASCLVWIFVARFSRGYSARAANENAIHWVACVKCAGASLHMCMTPHGPDTDTFERAVLPETTAEPARLPDDSLAFMCAGWPLTQCCMCWGMPRCLQRM